MQHVRVLVSPAVPSASNSSTYSIEILSITILERGPLQLGQIAAGLCSSSHIYLLQGSDPPQRPLSLRVPSTPLARAFAILQYTGRAHGGMSTAAAEDAAPAFPAAHAAAGDLRGRIAAAVAAGNGCLLAAAPAVVFRGTYAGRNIVGPNSTYSAANVDDRGYVPVEWWIMSKTVALNPVCKDHEGVTLLSLGGGGGHGDGAGSDASAGENTGAATVRFNEAVELAGDILLGQYTQRWPLTKVLDIGGAPVKPRFLPGSDTDVLAVLEAEARRADVVVVAESSDRSGGADSVDPVGGDASTVAPAHSASADQEAQAEEEYPPIPCHVHCGDFGGSGLGKLEAYFFPPLDVPPYNLQVGQVITRLGLKPSTTKEAVVGAMQRFGVDDSMCVRVRNSQALRVPRPLTSKRSRSGKTGGRMCFGGPPPPEVCRTRHRRNDDGANNNNDDDDDDHNHNRQPTTLTGTSC